MEKILLFFENLFKDSQPAVISIAVVLTFSLLLYWIVKRAINLMSTRGKLAAPVVSMILLLLRWSFLVITLLLVLQQAGMLQNVWAALLAVLAAVAIGFVAGWSILSNVFSTLLILIYRPFRIGDTIEFKTDEIKGAVVDINFVFTTLKGEEGTYAQIPNNTYFMKPMLRTPGKRTITLYEQLQADAPYNNGESETP